MWSFAETCPFLFFTLALFAMMFAYMTLSNFADALKAWGTKHCGSCACHTEQHGDEDDDALSNPESSTRV
jgi:hypothetical protein